MFEDLLNAFQNFRINKTRTILSLLGVIIGVAAVIIITTIGQSATTNMAATFGDSGLDLLQIQQGYALRSSGGTIQLDFNDDFRDELWGQVENIDHIFYSNSLGGTLRYGAIQDSASVSAIENGYLENVGGVLAEGSWFTESQNKMGSQKIILGHDIAETFFGEESPIGKVITLDISSGRSNMKFFGFEVIGVLEDNEGSGWENFNSKCYVPRGFYSKKIKPNANADSVMVKVINQDDTTSVSEQIEAYALKTFGMENVLYIWSLASMLENFNEMMGTMSLLLSCIAAISLLVGGIGIMNIMIVTVTERKKEIGIRKALGATPLAIQSQFLVEAAATTLIGGTLGIIFGLILSFGVTKVLGWAFGIQWNAVLLAFLFSVFVGVFFGYSPARKASKLDPVEALSSE